MVYCRWTAIWYRSDDCGSHSWQLEIPSHQESHGLGAVERTLVESRRCVSGLQNLVRQLTEGPSGLAVVNALRQGIHDGSKSFSSGALERSLWVTQSHA